MRGPRVTRHPRPLFRIRLRLALRQAGANLVCRIGRRAATTRRPCPLSFRAPNVGPGRHVLVVVAFDRAGNHSRVIKLPYYVRKRRTR